MLTYAIQLCLMQSARSESNSNQGKTKVQGAKQQRKSSQGATPTYFVIRVVGSIILLVVLFGPFFLIATWRNRHDVQSETKYLYHSVKDSQGEAMEIRIIQVT